ncbi:hypothetical protein [uncultured Rikenella sp.]|uniref:hypothetical protein n=1 Tax=uncultured Rikenella sp. TaxID=368003 RepID=UPI0026173408|nr:hypothetical protein [uncultured Rikenella sp.]
MLQTQHPAPGYRHTNSGTLVYIGCHGFSWSSATNDIDGAYLTFSTADLEPSFVNSRTYGFQLRCLSE